MEFKVYKVQARTQLADTPGSVFYRECEELFSEDLEDPKFDGLLDKFIEHFDVLFEKASDSASRVLRMPFAL